MSNEIRVSIICICFNQEKYIRRTLEGFVMQKTNFQYEVLIHDDASKDKTAEIIKEYESKYPDIIKPIYQTENQYSKGIKINATYNYPRAKGEYFAFCEGDDWWTDENKLQKQFDFLEAHPEYSACVHGSTTSDKDLNILSKTVTPYNCDTDISVEDMIEGGGGFVASASIFYRKNVRDNMPDFMVNGAYGFGDYQLQILCALKGKVRYFSDKMCNYTIQAYGSWTTRTDNKKGIAVYKKTNALLEEINRYTENKYESSIKKTIRENEFYIYRIKEEYKNMLKKEYRFCFNKLSRKRKLGIISRAYIPGFGKLYSILRDIKNAK